LIGILYQSLKIWFRLFPKKNLQSGGARTLIAFKRDDKAFFMYGFAKNQKENINDKELKALKRLANEFFKYNDNEIDQAIKAKEIIEVI